MAADFEDHVIATVNQLWTVAITDPKLAYSQMTKLPTRLHDSIVDSVSRGSRYQREIRKLLKTIEPETKYMHPKCDKP